MDGNIRRDSLCACSETWPWPHRPPDVPAAAACAVTNEPAQPANPDALIRPALEGSEYSSWAGLAAALLLFPHLTVLHLFISCFCCCCCFRRCHHHPGITISVVTALVLFVAWYKRSRAQSHTDQPSLRPHRAYTRNEIRGYGLNNRTVPQSGSKHIQRIKPPSVTVLRFGSDPWIRLVSTTTSCYTFTIPIIALQ